VSIDCNNYDYIEIACMHQYPIKLTLRTQSIVEGIALDTQLNASREECIKLMSDGEERLIVLDSISTLEVCVDNPHFAKVAIS